MLAQEWGPALVFMASPEEQTGEMISGNSLVGTHLMAATLRLDNIHKINNLMSVFFFALLLTARFLSFNIILLHVNYLNFGRLK